MSINQWRVDESAIEVLDRIRRKPGDAARRIYELEKDISGILSCLERSLQGDDDTLRTYIQNLVYNKRQSYPAR